MNAPGLRKQMLAKRAALTDVQVAESSCLLAQNVLSLLPYQTARTVLLYHPYKGEISPLGLIGPDKLYALVRTLQDGNMEAVQWAPGMALTKSRFGVLEPTGGQVLAPEQVDAVIVPALACDRRGNRLGHGAGFYDRYLAVCPAVRIAVLHDFQLVDVLIPSPHDMPMDFIVTPDQIISCKDVSI